MKDSTCAWIGLEAFERQSEIIRIQSGIIDELFRALLQFEAVDGMDREIFDRMEYAAKAAKGLRNDN